MLITRNEKGGKMKKLKETTAYCYDCDEYVEYVQKEVKKSINVRGEKITCLITECYCKNCGERVLVESIEKENQIKVYDLYKEKVGLLTSEEIRSILRKRDMKQKELATFLSIGEKDITRYLNGSIQSKNIDKMLRLVDDDEAFARMTLVFEGKRIEIIDAVNSVASGYFDKFKQYILPESYLYTNDLSKGELLYGKQNGNALA